MKKVFKITLLVIFLSIFFIIIYIHSYNKKIDILPYPALTVASENDNKKIQENIPAKNKFQQISINTFANEVELAPPFEMPEIIQPVFNSNECNIVDYGAKSDGITKNTKAINEAISDCALKGGGKVIIPAGKWITGAIHLESNMNLNLGKDAELIFSSNPEDYLPAVFSRYEGIEYYNYSPLIYAHDCKNIAITGEGKMIGNGSEWIQNNDSRDIRKLYNMGRDNVAVSERIFANADKFLRPNFIQFINCDSILLEDFKIENGPMWTINPVYSKNIIIRKINIFTNGKNNDGIDIDSSQNVLIEDSVFNTHDDTLVLKSGKGNDGLRVNQPTRNVIIRNNTIIGGHGAIAIGSEVAGGISNVFAYNNKINQSQFGIRLKALSDEKGDINNVWIKDSTINNTLEDAIQITMFYGGGQLAGETGLPVFENINIENIKGQANHGGISILGMENNPIQNVTLKNVNLGTNGNSQISSLTNSVLDSVLIKSTKNPAFVFKNTQNVTVKNSNCLSSQVCILLEGANNVDLKNNVFYNQRGKIKFN